MELRRVAVTGLGALTPLGNDVQTFWSNAIQGVSGAAPITRFDASKFKTQFACEVKFELSNSILKFLFLSHFSMFIYFFKIRIY